MSREELLASIPAGHPDEMLVRQVNFERLPEHIAIIMDGNGRWAAQRHLPRVEGHRAGIDAVRDTVETAARLGIKVLTLYAFSIENWKRPAAEISTLMMLLKRYLRSELRTLLTNDIRFRVIGRMDDLADDIQDELRAAMDRTADDAGMLFNIALNYGGRAEIVDAARRAIEAGIRADDLDEQKFSSFLYTAGQPDPDLLIRTSGEMRVSNYLLWQIAYAEIYVAGLAADEYVRITNPQAARRLEGFVVIAVVVYTCWWAAVPAPLSIVLLSIVVILWLAFAVLRQSMSIQQAAADLV